MLPEVGKLLEAQVLAAGLAEGADLLAEHVVVGTQSLVRFVEVATGADHRDEIAEPGERCAQTHQCVAKRPGQSCRLAEEQDPPCRQHSDDHQILSLQSCLCCRHIHQGCDYSGRRDGGDSIGGQGRKDYAEFFAWRSR